jgi:tetratricopeptide (TPR) repeat protein
VAKGEFALGRESFEKALTLTIEPSKWGATPLKHDLYALLADEAVLELDLQALQKYVPLAEESAARINHRLYLSIAWRAWGVAHRLLGEYDQAESRLYQALETFRELNASWQLGRTWFELGELAKARLQHQQAKEYFAQAKLAFSSLGAIPYQIRANAALVELN